LVIAVFEFRYFFARHHGAQGGRNVGRTNSEISRLGAIDPDMNFRVADGKRRVLVDHAWRRFHQCQDLI
jgi:hypothetical protein